MERVIEKFRAHAARMRCEYECKVLRETGNAERFEAAITELQAAKQRGYLPLSGKRGGNYIMGSESFIAAGAANCSYLLYWAGITRVDPIGFHLPFERFLNPLVGGPLEIPLAAVPRTRVARGDIDLAAALSERGHPAESFPPCDCSAAGVILRETNGRLVFQEQAMHLLHTLGGYSYAEAELLRRRFAKALPREDVQALEEQFIARAVKRGLRQRDAQQVIREIAEWGGKLLPKCALLGELLNG